MHNYKKNISRTMALYRYKIIQKYTHDRKFPNMIILKKVIMLKVNLI